MTGRERFLRALSNEKPDRLPFQVHNWMSYYLEHSLGGLTDIEAYEKFGMDPVLYREPKFIFDDKTLANWQENWKNLGKDQNGNPVSGKEIVTPDGTLMMKYTIMDTTWWLTEPPCKNEADFEIWNKYVPVPSGVDWTPVREAKELLGDRGIVRGAFFDFGQGSPWQSFSDYVYGTESAIFLAMDEPETLHHMLDEILKKKLRAIEVAGNIELDLVETGGGGGSSTVISPAMHEEFCLPYDRIQHRALHEAGTKVVYHLCGGLMPLLEMVSENGADALETMTPPEMGGDCDLAEAARRVGDKLCFVGGFDQNAGFEKGTKEYIEQTVRKLFASKPNGGYIISPSDHFFYGKPENIQYFVDACKACKY